MPDHNPHSNMAIALQENHETDMQHSSEVLTIEEAAKFLSI